MPRTRLVGRRRMLVAALLAACGSPPLPRSPDVPVPESMQGHFMTADGSYNHLFVHDTMLSASNTGAEYDSHLSIGVAHLDGERYVAEGGEVVGPHSTLFGGVEYRIDTTCGGTAAYEDDVWTVALTGDYHCQSYNGTFPRVDQPSAHPRRAPRGVASHDGLLHVVVPPDESPFAHALQGVDTMEPGDAPCPVTLRAPSADMASGDDPGQAALAHHGEGSGEELEVVHVDSGIELPTAPESRLRYQAVYVRVEHTEPSVDSASGTFEAGTSRGRAFLVDTEEGRVVCVGDVQARNGDAIRGDSDARALMWLTLQLGMAEERAIALGLRVPAPTTPVVEADELPPR